ncbi:hypothetical protein [Flavobacterium sp. FlaQc-48]|uniref:hypothetical protein n=1 Tax=Flavobacterium sp. FlaQc-48 TaxID=3374181 RepID=UPI0037569D87
MSMITSMFYAQSTDEIESFDRANKTVLSAIPHLMGKDYFIWEGKVGQMTVISKINNIYTYYNLELGRTEAAGDKIIDTRTINYNPVLDKIFTTFVPKAGVTKYQSVYPREFLQLTYYFAIYKNGVKTFDTCFPHTVNGVYIESPIDDETLDFLYDNVLVNPDKL